LKPSEITARLGAPWLSTKVIAVFRKDIPGVETTVRHITELGSWMLDIRLLFVRERCS
jgi:N12 class adenine-specific DNA methylase